MQSRSPGPTTPCARPPLSTLHTSQKMIVLQGLTLAQTGADLEVHDQLVHWTAAVVERVRAIVGRIRQGFAIHEGGGDGIRGLETRVLRWKRRLVRISIAWIPPHAERYGDTGSQYRWNELERCTAAHDHRGGRCPDLQCSKELGGGDVVSAMKREHCSSHD